MSGTLLLTDVRPFGGPPRDLLVVDGRIARVGKRLQAPEDAAWSPGAATWPSPAWSTAHAHLDKTRGGWRGGRTPPGRDWRR